MCEAGRGLGSPGQFFEEGQDEILGFVLGQHGDNQGGRALVICDTTDTFIISGECLPIGLSRCFHLVEVKSL